MTFTYTKFSYVLEDERAGTLIENNLERIRGGNGNEQIIQRRDDVNEE